MRRIKIRTQKSAGVRNMIVLAMLSFVVAAPLSSLPLGLNAFAMTAPLESVAASAATAAQVSSKKLFVAEVTPQTLSAGDVDFTDASLNRSQSDLAAEIRTDSAEIRLDAAMAAATEPVLISVDYPVYIAADVLNVRNDATTTGEIVAKIQRGDRISVIGEWGDWLQIEADDQFGFIKKEYTSTEMVFRAVDETLYVKGTSLNVRDTYTTEGALLVELDQGDQVHRTGIGDEWSRIIFEDGREGYVASKYLTKKTSADVSESLTTSSESGENVPANNSGNTIVDLAYQALGTPYVYGSESLKGMDCSGLVYWAYNQVGVSVPRSSASFASAGEAVDLSNAQLGDVLCIDARPRDGRSRITHVAIYIGDGQVIHASTSQRSVVTSSIESFYNVGYTILTVRRFPN